MAWPHALTAGWTRSPWFWGGGLGAGTLLAIGGVLWLIRRWRRPTADEAECLRRLHVNAIGRIAGGEILDMLPAPVEDAEGKPPLLVYQYEVGGVVYQVSQPLHLVPIVMEPESWTPGWPVQVKYDPANPGNSIVACEHWRGLSARRTRAAATGNGVSA